MCGVVVVMIGDGVNDLLVLKMVDIGILMGKLGMDVVKEVVDVIFVDDDFVFILFVVEEGKLIFYNI